MNMIKVLWRRFKKWLGTFTMLLVEGSSETRILRHVYDYVFRFRNFGNTKSMRLIFFRKRWIISAKFQKCSEKSENLFCFWDNWMWIGIVKLSLLRTRYFHWAANVLTSSTKILRLNKKDFLELSWLGSDQRIWKSAVTKISKVLGSLYHPAFWRVLWNGTFETFIWLFFRSR